MGGGVYGVVLVHHRVGSQIEESSRCGYLFCIETPEANQNYISAGRRSRGPNGVVVQ
jgi:hypothetical protein